MIELIAQVSSVTQPAVYVPVIVVLMAVASWALRLNGQVGALTRKVERVDGHCTRLVVMHEDPDKYGFGTVALRAMHEAERAETRQLISNNTRVMRELVHYFKVSIEHATGKKPPPPEPDLENPGG